MENNNWRPNQQPPGAAGGGGGGSGGEPAVLENGDWRAHLHPDSRQRIVNKIMDTLERHLPFSGQEGLQELRKIAVRFEEKIYSAATSQSDYLRKISMKMLTMETKSQNNLPNSLPPNHPANSSNPASNSMQSQVPNQGQSLPIKIPANQPQTRQQMLPQTIQNNIASAGAQSSAGLASAPPPVSGVTQAPISNVSGQITVGISMSQGTSNVFTNSQGQQIQGRQQVAQPQQLQTQNSQQYLYQQQLQQELLKQKLQQGNIPQPLMQSHLQRQQNLFQPTQLQSSQQSVMQSSSVIQPSMMQSASVSGLQQNQQPSLQQSSQSMIHQQSVLRQQQQQQQQQAAVITQQQTSMSQQPTLPPQQQQPPLMGQQSSAGNMQQSQLIGQQNQLSGQQSSVGDMQQQQRSRGQQNNLSNVQQHQLMAQSRHQQQLASQNTVSGLSHQQQQPQLLGSQPNNSGMQTGQHSVHLLQQSKVQGQQQTQGAVGLLPTQGQQSQQLQQQLVSQIQSQPLHMQQQPNTLQQNMQQRLQSGSLLQQQSAADQQKQLYLSQRALPETSSTSMDSTAQTGLTAGDDWQEEIYQKIKTMKETYLPDLSEMYQRIASKIQQHESLQPPTKSDQVDKLKTFESMLKRMMGFLQISKNNITMNCKEKLGAYEKQIVNLIHANRPRRPMPQGQLTMSSQMMQQSQQSQSQSTQVQLQENQMNPQLQPMNMRGPVPAMQQNNMSSLQQNMVSLQQNSMSTLPTIQQNIVNTVQPSSSLESGQANSLNALQHVAAGSLQQNPGSSQPANNNNLSSQSGVNALQSNINSNHSNSNLLQNQNLKQQQEQHMLQAQQLKQIQQRQMQQQLMQKQQQQQLHQQPKQQQSAQLQPHRLSQMHQMNDMNLRQGKNVKPEGVLQPHSVGQHTGYQQLKQGNFPASSAQLQTTPQHSSPQIDQKILVTSITRAATPLQSTTPPFVVPSPSTSVAPSPMPGESEKPVSAVSTQPNAGNIGHQQSITAGAPAQSLAIGTPGISASPLLAEFSGPDGSHGNSLMNIPGKSSVTEQPIERLIRAVKSISPAALEASVSDIGAVVSMMDRVAGSAPGNGSRAAVGEDLVAMTKCRLQARNYMTHEGPANKKMRRHTSAMPINVPSSVNEGPKQSATSELESTATSNVKRTKNEASLALMEEIKRINQRLIDTVVDISEEVVDPTAMEASAKGSDGIIVKCSYCAVALSPSLKLQFASAQLSPIQPLRLLVPSNYPNCSPVLLDKLPVEVSKEHEDLSVKAKSRFSISLRSLSQPMSLWEIAMTWDNCARAVIIEYAQQSGGGSFSSKYGTWEDCLSAA